ncbi:MAG: aldehyde dehydrogenase family protein [Alphaproteobacteria bacterium]|nr:aldehyde dehydrogenase family protein [Alphaproteobacteria bacterium]MBU0794832.1 aldehyde dehydrogenase family protein [Alphaproteobacteria bacterium]MBU0874640.1 aldehyde dehydrogenase family protein [Alphaproteobacteria bacterium]MBU1768024.1 aldehyde dehydrogenase family protein [Alphaproteobacteria bacterium]
MNAVVRSSKFFIGGKWVEPHGREVAEVRSPADHSLIGRAALGDAVDADRAVAAARNLFPIWSQSSIDERLAVLRRMRKGFDEAAPAIEEHLIREIGLTRMVAQGQSMMCRAHFDSMLEILPEYPFTLSMSGGFEIVREPVGVVVAITSWNAPVNQMLCKAVPAIAAGCPVIVKPSEHAPLCGILLAEAMAGADLPPGLFNLVNGRGADCGQRLAEHPHVDMISITGSVAGGAAVAEAAAPTIKRVHQELGGKGPNILLPDADFETVVPRSVLGAMMVGGQVCAAPTRLIVPAERFEEVARLAVAAAEQIVVGSPDEPATTYGPLMNEVQFVRVNRMIEQALADGQPLLTGGPGRPDHLSTGFYVRPTIFGPVAPDADIATQEIFGPVLCILTYRDIDEAVEIANATDFGLAAYVQSADPVMARAVAGRLRAGYVTINFPAWTAAAPFGGYKRSGNGRQYGVWGLEEFLETKTIIAS